MFGASAHLPVKTYKILMERKSGSSGKHQNDLPLGGPCSWCRNTTHADRLQKTCFTGVSDICATISLIDASFTSNLWIPAAVHCGTIVPPRRKTHTFWLSVLTYVDFSHVWVQVGLVLSPSSKVQRSQLRVCVWRQCWVVAAAHLNCCSVQSKNNVRTLFNVNLLMAC